MNDEILINGLRLEALNLSELFVGVFPELFDKPMDHLYRFEQLLFATLVGIVYTVRPEYKESDNFRSEIDKKIDGTNTLAIDFEKFVNWGPVEYRKVNAAVWAYAQLINENNLPIEVYDFRIKNMEQLEKIGLFLISKCSEFFGE